MIFDITYSKQVNALLPPHRRKRKILAYFIALVKPIQWLRDLFFGLYRIGSADPDYNSGSTYTKGQRVVFSDKGVYEALKNVPTGAIPINPDYWIKISNNFIGADQRLKFNSSVMILHGDGNNPAYSPSGTANQNGALNKWFGVDTAPWIYISNNDVDSDGFFIGRGSAQSSTMARNSRYQVEFLGRSYTITGQDDFTVKVPSAVFAQINSDPLIAKAIIRSFLDPIILAGTKYSIETY
jgi:hypothetical protein